MFKAFFIPVVLLLFLCAQTLQAQRWERVALPGNYDSAYYLDVFFLPSDPLYGWACDNDSGFVVRTINGGQTWAGSKVMAGNTFCHLEYVQFLDRVTGYASGPCGVFKSTNGGVSWTQLTVSATAIVQWGAWFKTALEGWVTGGGCGINNFYHTTDGGQTFTVFADTNIKRSNLSDPLWNSQMPAGYVYAIGNGTLWRSTDDGTNWAVASYTGTNSPWHEELAMFGNTICVPSATSNCASGGFTGGSIRTSTDAGSTWSETMTTGDMFGTFLLNEQNGWACGWNTNVWQTTNGGQSWTSRTCGMENGNADDVYFINDSTGWIAGTGLYRLAKPLRTQNKTAVNFNLVCPNTPVRDTIYVRNMNFYASNWTARITGTDADLFRIINAPLSAQIQSCGPQPVVIEYNATRPGAHSATLTIDIRNPDTTLVVSLQGSRSERTGYPVDTLVTINARVGQTFDRQLNWSATGRPTERILLIDRISGDTSISLIGAVPISLEPPPVNSFVIVRVTASDTGWTSARFKVIIGPCLRDTFITVRVYGVSPIMNSIASAAINSKCLPFDTLRVPVWNSGNYPLTISAVRTEALSNNAFKFLRFVSNRPSPYVLDVGVTDTALVLYSPLSGNDAADLVMTHDDLTTARKVASPYRVALNGISARPELTTQSDVLDFGTICVNSVAEKGFTISNIGSPSATIVWEENSDRITGLPNGPAVVTPGQSKSIRVTFSSAVAGSFTDTISVRISPCDSIMKIIVTGNVVDSRLNIAPATIRKPNTVGQLVSAKSYITIRDANTATVTSITVTPTPANLTVITPTLPVTLTATDTLEVELQFTAANEDDTYSGTIEANGKGLCGGAVKNVVEFNNSCRGLDAEFSSLNLVEQCGPTEIFDSVKVYNDCNHPITASATIRAGSSASFRVVSPVSPLTVNYSAEFYVVVGYLPTGRGTHSGVLDVLNVEQNRVLGVDLVGTLLMPDVLVTPVAIDFGEVKSCTPDSVVEITLTNNGDFDEVFTVVNVTLPGGITVPTANIGIPKGGTAKLQLLCSPPSTSTGANSGGFTIRAQKCGQEVNISATVLNNSGSLTIDPATANYGTIAPGDTAQRTFTISNPLLVSRTISTVTIDPPTAPFEISSDVSGTVLNAGQSVQITVGYVPSVVGDDNARVIVTDVSSCPTQVSSSIVGRARVAVAPPVYTMGLKIDHHRADPDKPVTIPIHFTNDCRQAALTEFETTVSYSGLLCTIDNVTIETLPDAEVAVSFSDGVMSIKAKRAGANFGAPGVLATLGGIAHPAIPDSTGFVFSNTTYEAGEQIEIKEEDGSLVVEACGPRFLIKLGEPVTIRILPPNPAGSEVEIEISALIPQSVQLDVVNDLGISQTMVQNLALAEGSTHIRLSLQNVASGLYGLRCQTSIGGTYIIPLIVVK